MSLRDELIEAGAQAIWTHAGWRPESWEDAVRSRETYTVEAGLALDAMLNVLDKQAEEWSLLETSGVLKWRPAAIRRLLDVLRPIAEYETLRGVVGT